MGPPFSPEERIGVEGGPTFPGFSRTNDVVIAICECSSLPWKPRVQANVEASKSESFVEIKKSLLADLEFIRNLILRMKAKGRHGEITPGMEGCLMEGGDRCLRHKVGRRTPKTSIRHQGVVAH